MSMTRRRLLDDSYKKTVSGNPAIAQGSLARMYPGITMQGWTEQDSTTGAQLLDETVIEQGMLGYGPNGNGEEIASQIMCRSDFIPIKPNEQYYFSGEYANYIGFYNADKEYINSTNLISFQTPENALYVRLRWYSNGENLTPDQVKKGKPMLNAGSTALPWEPYTGGEPSPSPEYPQEIVSAGNYNEETQKYEYDVDVTGANLLDASELEIGGLNGVTGAEFVTQNRIRTGFISVKSGDKYTVSGYSPYVIMNSSVFQSDKTTRINNFLNGGDIPEGGAYVRISFKKSDESNFTEQELEALKKTIMFNYGITALPYEPYRTPQSLTLTADRPLTKWDKLEKRGGQWGWEYKSAEIVFDGSEKWLLYPSANVGTVFYTALSNASFGFQTSLCDKYRNINNVWDVSYDGVFGVYSDNTSQLYKYFRPPSAAVETVEQFKAWLSENPLTLWYEIAEETFVPLSASEQGQMNALHTNRPTTVLSNNQNCEMSLTYKTRKSMEVTA